jgi:hypothetical protein
MRSPAQWVADDDLGQVADLGAQALGVGDHARIDDTPCRCRVPPEARHRLTGRIVRALKGDEIQFEDGSIEKIDEIIFATGHQASG